MAAYWAISVGRVILVAAVGVSSATALAELERAWADGGYHGFCVAEHSIWCAISSSGEVLTANTPDGLDQQIRAHGQARIQNTAVTLAQGTCYDGAFPAPDRGRPSHALAAAWYEGEDRFSRAEAGNAPLLPGSGNDGSPFWRMHCVMARARSYGVFPPPSTGICCGPGPVWHPATSIMLPITAALRSVRRSDAGRRSPRLRDTGSFIVRSFSFSLRSALPESGPPGSAGD
jgi:hypothetical protein